MGTNYYARVDACPHCGRSDEQVHIGKSSAGWCFSLHVDPDLGLNSLEDWIEYLKDKSIYNEYEEYITLDELRETIEQRRRDVAFKDREPFGYNDWNHFHEMNHSEFGPNNMLRHKVDGWHCIGHGDGTYDYITGEFS